VTNNTSEWFVRIAIENLGYLTLENIKTNIESQLTVQGLFVAIGHTLNSQLFSDQGLIFDETGYIQRSGQTTATNIPGVFVAGDVSDHVYRQAITAAGMGCQAAIDAQHYLESLDWIQINQSNFIAQTMSNNKFCCLVS